MKISIVDVDGHNFPNLALMKLSAWYKAQGDSVDWYEPLFSDPDKIYESKVFTFSQEYKNYSAGDPEPIRGGTGYRMYQDLPPEIDSMLPDYSIYPQYSFAVGFLSRGCIRNCPFCVVPRKEGALRQYDDIERITQGRKHIVFLDNNFLANDFEFVKEQLEKAKRMKLKLDFNQGLDARLVTEENAKLLAKTDFVSSSGNNRYIRLACDTMSMLPHIKNAVTLLRKAGYTKGFFVYVLAKEIKETLERIVKLCEIDKKIDPFCQPYRDLDGDGHIIDSELKHLARWCNSVWIRKSCKYEEYKHGET